MTPEPQKEYIITEEQLKTLIYARYSESKDEGEDDEIHNLIAPVLKRVRASHSPTAELVLDTDEIDYLVGLIREDIIHDVYKTETIYNDSKKVEVRSKVAHLQSQRGRE